MEQEGDFGQMALQNDSIASEMTTEEKLNIVMKHRENRIQTGYGIPGCLCAGCMGNIVTVEPVYDTGEMAKDGMFTITEQELFAQNLGYRKAMLEQMFIDGVPMDNSSRRIVNELITSTETALLQRAKQRHAVKKDGDNSQIIHDAASALQNLLALRRQDMPEIGQLPEQYEKVSKTEGHIAIGRQHIDPSDYFDDEE